VIYASDAFLSNCWEFDGGLAPGAVSGIDAAGGYLLR
jgi:hypothetical protein